MTVTTEAPTTTTSARVESVSTQFAPTLLGVPGDELAITWTVAADRPGLTQLAYEIEVASDLSFRTDRATTGEVPSNEAISRPAPGGRLESRETRFVRVRIRTEDGWSEWGPVARVEAGLTSADDWSATAVGIPSTVEGPAPMLRTEFHLDEVPITARLYVTSLGLNTVEINGSRVDDVHLAPGWTSYDGRLVVSTVDVTAALRYGANAIGATLADGWYRGALGWTGQHSHYGDELALIAQLEMTFADGSTRRVVTDPSWRGSFGSIRAAGIYLGCDLDQREHPNGWSSPGFDDSAWSSVQVVPLDTATLDPNTAPPVRTVDERPMERLENSPGFILDSGQNLAGWVRLTVEGTTGDTVVVRHAEVLESDGTLHTRSLRTARATDTYVLEGDGTHVLEPEFTFHGFRYADVVTTARVVSATAIAISSDIQPRSTFTSSEPRLERLHSNVAWSQRSNFVSVPTDCPQRDERLGWTGDAQAFAATANTLFHSAGFWASWLKDLELDQAADGAVASVVPNILQDDAFLIEGVGQNLMGRAGWADAASIIPWSLHESYGDLEVLRQQLGSMRRWVDHLDARRGGMPLLPTEFQFGDWLDPDAPGDQPWLAKVSSDFVANAFFARVARLQEWTEGLVGDPARAAHYSALADTLAATTWATWGEHATSSQTGCAIALEFDLVPPADRGRVGRALAAHVRASGGRISTGFLGTPLVLHALTSTGHLDEAYLMLLCRETPSWLYQVEMGATTVWERWDALSPDGSIHSGGMSNSEDAQMLSFNHYAYGAVVDWLYRTVAGIAPDPSGPGYRRFRVAPRPTASVSAASATIDAPLGRIDIRWTVVDSGSLEIDLTVPFGSEAILDLPLTAQSQVSASGVLSYGTHRIVVTDPAIAAV